VSGTNYFIADRTGSATVTATLMYAIV